VFALDLMSTYEGEHTIFGLLGQANLTQNDVLQFHPSKCHLNNNSGQATGLMPGILAPQEAEIRRLLVQSQPRPIVH
jgi:hypothetical protein